MHRLAILTYVCTVHVMYILLEEAGVVQWKIVYTSSREDMVWNCQGTQWCVMRHSITVDALLVATYIFLETSQLLITYTPSSAYQVSVCLCYTELGRKVAGATCSWYRKHHASGHSEKQCRYSTASANHKQLLVRYMWYMWLPLHFELWFMCMYKIITYVTCNGFA